MSEAKMNWIELERWVSMCRCGHENSIHKHRLDEGRPTGKYPCHEYGCVCGVFEAIDWDESDANHEAERKELIRRYNLLCECGHRNGRHWYAGENGTVSHDCRDCDCLNFILQKREGE